LSGRCGPRPRDPLRRDCGGQLTVATLPKSFRSRSLERVRWPSQGFSYASGEGKSAARRVYGRWSSRARVSRLGPRRLLPHVEVTARSFSSRANGRSWRGRRVRLPGGQHLPNCVPEKLLVSSADRGPEFAGATVCGVGVSGRSGGSSAGRCPVRCPARRCSRERSGRCRCRQRSGRSIRAACR
jgi:hypothetical protein